VKKINELFWIRAALKRLQDPATLFIDQDILEFGEVSSHEAGLILLLSGAADVLDRAAHVAVMQRQNLGVLGAPNVGPVRQAKLEEALLATELDLDALNRYLRKGVRQQAYYREISLEIVHFFFQRRNGRHTLAFLHLYRFLERIAFVFPITYAISSTDFKGTFSALKAYFAGDKGGELGFFARFQDAVLDPSLLSAPAEFDFDGLASQSRAYAIARGLVKDDDVIDSKPESSMTLRFGAVAKFAIELRNRFFHAGSGHPGNISLIDVADPDAFFGRVNEHVANWFAVVYFQTLISKVERYS
jgi:hypothetical protein